MRIHRATTLTRSLILSATFLLVTGAVQAEELLCQGSITSIQGEGLVNRTHRFELSGLRGADVAAVIEKSRKIALQRQDKALRKGPYGNFRQLSTLDLECLSGSQKLQIQRTIKTRP